MRVLYLSRADEFRDKSSLVIIAKSVIKHMLQFDPEMYVTWVIPEGTKPEILDEFVLQEMPDPKRLGFLPVMAGLSGRTLGYFMTQDLWYAATQTKVQVPYDVVLSNQLAMTPIWNTVLTNRYMSSRYAVKVPIVNWQMWTATHQQLAEVPEYYAGEADVVAESLSSLFATNVWESEVLYKAHLETMRQYVKPSVMQKIMQQSHVIANGVDFPALQEVWMRRQIRMEKGKGPVLFWGGRLANQKKPRITFPLMEKTRQVMAKRPEVVVSTNRPESDPDVAWARDSYPDWRIHWGVSRQEFFGLLEAGDVFLCNSASESYGVAWLEMLATGMIGVFEKAWWNEALLPDWYPFVFKSHEDMFKAAAMLLRTWPDGEHWNWLVTKVRQWIATEHSEVVCASRLDGVLREEKAFALVEDRGKATGSLGVLAHECAESLWHGEPIPEEEIWREMTGRSESKREFGHAGDVISRMYLRRCLEAGDWIDVCRSNRVEFAKRS